MRIKQAYDIGLGDWLMPDDGQVIAYSRSLRSDKVTIGVMFDVGYREMTIPGNAELRVFSDGDQQKPASVMTH